MEELLIIRANETKQKIINTINESGLPAFVINYIIKEIQQQVEPIEQSQLQQALHNKEEREKQEKEKKEKEVKDGQD